VTPMNPLVELGSYIELNCTLTGDVAPFNSSHLYFQAGSKVISSEFYTILSPTIMTYKENMTGQYTGRYPFYCYLNQSTSEENMKPRLIGSQVATIGSMTTIFTLSSTIFVKPLHCNVIGCLLTSCMFYFICSWKVGRLDSLVFAG
ncbi:unnamed protein product, partial [Owenia fusiformis]